jgi:hypothetical protein
MATSTGQSVGGLRKLSCGCYEHRASGRLVVRTSGWEGPRGGNHDVWELGKLQDDEVIVDGMDMFRTRREAISAIEANR